MTQRKEIRVFVSSPGDCDSERQAVSRVLDELNRTVGEREHLFFQVLRWEDFAPGVGNNPQTVIDEQLGEYNVLVGIMWMRFGTPISGGANSGTEHEVDQAIQSFKRVGVPRVMFYFKEDPPDGLYSIDLDQLKKVRAFRSKLEEIGLINLFRGTDAFEANLRLHLNKLINKINSPTNTQNNNAYIRDIEPYDGFLKTFREVIAPQRLENTDALFHIVFGNISDIEEISPVIPVGQAFDFWQRGSRSVLASFEEKYINGQPFFEYIEERWPPEARPRAAGLGHTKYLELPNNIYNWPGVFFVVTTRDLSAARHHYGLYANTPIEGIDFIIEQVIKAANIHKLPSLAIPLLGTGYANIRRTIDHARFSRLLQHAVALLTIQKLHAALQDVKVTVRRAVLVIWSSNPQGQDEHDLWESVTRFLGRQQKQRNIQIKELLDEINKICT